MVQADGMVGASVLCVPTLGDVSVILYATLGGVVVSTIFGAECLTLCVVDVCTTLGGAPDLFRWA